jgi:hypothetical protein
MLSSRDGERMLKISNSGSMKSPRLSEITTGRTIALISKEMEVLANLELSRVSLQGGGNYSKRRENLSSMKKER